jgi:hypothetical protein
VPLADTEELSWGADNEASAIDAPWWRRPGWIWLGYIMLGVAFWTAVGFGIQALIAAL